MNTSEGLLHWLTKLNEDGFVVLRNSPAEETVVVNLANLISNPQVAPHYHHVEPR